MELSETARDHVLGSVRHNISFGLTQQGQTLYSSVVEALTALCVRILLAKSATMLNTTSEAELEAALIREGDHIANKLLDAYYQVLTECLHDKQS